jgi:hypothetical protein
MGKIGYGYGSEWHLLRFLGYHRQYLSKQVLNITGGKDISWLDFRFSKKYAFLNHDRELVGLEFIKDPEVTKKWGEFWPQTGTSQNWDAVGKIEYGDHSEWLLVEAKAHGDEVRSSCGAVNPKSIEKINIALQKAIHSFGADKTSVENWLSPYYQYANRLASLHFLMKECNPAISARLLFIYFYGDHRPDEACPQNEDEWHQVLVDMEGKLGIDRLKNIYSRVHHLFLPVNPNIID